MHEKMKAKTAVAIAKERGDRITKLEKYIKTACDKIKSMKLLNYE